MGLVFICVLLGSTSLITGRGKTLDLRGDAYSAPWRQKLTMLDLPGTILLVGTAIALFTGLELSQVYTWSSARTIVPLAVSVTGVAALVIQQRMVQPPRSDGIRVRNTRIFDPAIISLRAVWAPCGLGFCSMSSIAVLIVFLPFQLQLLKGLSPAESGLRSFPLVLSITVGSGAASLLSTVVPFWNPPAIAGASCLMAAAAVILRMGLGFTIPQVEGYQVLAGLGTGVSWISELLYPRAVLDKHQLAHSLGYTRMLQQLGA